MSENTTPEPTPIRIGVLHDFPPVDGGESFERAVRLGVDDVAKSGRIDRPLEFRRILARGLPVGSEHEVVTAFHELEEEGCLLVLGPAVTDNGLIVQPLADAFELPSINWTGGERTRGEFAFNYQIGSLEEEPPILARRLTERGLRRPAVLFETSPIGRRFAEGFEAACASYGLDLAGSVPVASLIDDATPFVERARACEPDALVYLGLGATSGLVGRALQAAGWDVPVVSNSGLMFGYLHPEWQELWRGWEYVDGIADDNEQRRRLAARLPEAAAGPVGCGAYDMGRLVGEAIARSHHLTRVGLKEGLERVKQLPATSGYEGTTMGFGVYDHAALKGRYLVLRTWRDGQSIQVDT